MLINNKVIKNYILLLTIKRLEISYKPKESLYLLITILGDLIFYKNRIICIKIKGWKVIISFNILPLGNNKAVLKIP